MWVEIDMPDSQTQYTFDRVVRMVLGGAVLIGAVVLLRYLSDVLLPFAAAVVLAYLLNPMVTFLQRKIRRRGPAVALTIAGLGIVGCALIALLLPLAYSQVTRLTGDLVKLREDLAAPIVVKTEPIIPSDKAPADAKSNPQRAEKSVTGWRELKEGLRQYRAKTTLPSSERLRLLRERVADTYVGRLLDAATQYAGSEEFRSLLVSAAKHLAVGGWSVLMVTVNLVLGLTGLIIVLLYLVFLLLDYPEYARTWKSFLPPQYREPIVAFVSEFNLAMRRYFRGQSIVALLTGVLFVIGFSIIGLPLAVPFGLFVGLLNMVPYLQAVALVPGVLLAVVRSVEHDSSLASSILLVLLVFALAQLIQDVFITPRIIGRATGLRPLAILLGVFVWAKLLGFLGLLLAIPLTCLVIAYYRRYVLEQGHSKALTASGS